MTLNYGDLRFWLQTALFLVLAVSAWRWGGGPERALAAILVWFNAGDAANHALFGAWTDYDAVNIGHVVIDGAGLLAAVLVAVYANRHYPLWFAAFQLVAVMAHLGRSLAPNAAPLAYAVMWVGPSYCQMLILTLGIWLHRRRVRDGSPVPSWRTSLLRSQDRASRGWPNA